MVATWSNVQVRGVTVGVSKLGVVSACVVHVFCAFELLYRFIQVRPACFFFLTDLYRALSVLAYGLS